MTKKHNLSVKFSIQQALYWAAYCSMISYAVTFLLSKGFKASEAGTVLFCSNFLSFVFQPFIASKADKANKNVIPAIIVIQCLISVLCFSIIMISNLSKPLLSLFFLMGVAAFDMEAPLLNAIVIYYTDRNWSINYGLGRGVGSFGYGLTSLVLGFVMEKSGVDIMLPISVTLSVLFIVVSMTYPKEEKVFSEKDISKPCSLLQFVARYRWYVISLFGLLFTAMIHLMMENYLIEVFRSLGGGSSNIGVALFIATMTETFVLFVISKLFNKIGSYRLLIIGGISYIIKVILFVVAKSVWVIYVAQLLQMTSYTFISPIQMYYAQECTNSVDMVKGQSMSTAFWAIGCALGNLLGGVLISAFGLKTMLLTALGITILGTLIFIISVPKAQINSIRDLQ